MATPRGPRGFSYNRPPAAVPRVYEKFTPSSEWKRDKESDILLIFLPDFLPQNIRITTEAGNILRVTGERPDGGNKMSRFQEDFEIPKHCNVQAIRAKFEGGILTIIFPQIANTTTAAAITPKTSQPDPKLTPPRKQDKEEPTEVANPKTSQPDPKLTPSQKQDKEEPTEVAKPKTSQPDPKLTPPRKQDKEEPTSEAAIRALPTPSSEWKQDKESDILLIFLPDFLPQNIRITTETGNILRVTGERPDGGNKMSRFQEDFEIPKHCNVQAIRAKFEGGILTIIFPQIANTTTAAAITPKTSQPDPKLTPSQKQDKEEPTEVAKPKTSQPDPKLTPSQKQDKEEPTEVAKPKTSQPDPKLPPPRKQDNKEPTSEAAIRALPTPILKERTYQTTEAPIPRTPALPSPELKELERSRFQKPSPPKLKHASNIDADLPKEARKFIESSRPPLVVDDKTPLLPTLGTAKGATREEVIKGKDDVKKEGEMYTNGLEKRAGMDKAGDVETKDREHNVKDEKETVEKTDQVDIKQAMKSLGRRINEEKESVVNMGAAVMVIVGLGAYVYHSLSSGKLAKR